MKGSLNIEAQFEGEKALLSIFLHQFVFSREKIKADIA